MKVGDVVRFKGSDLVIGIIVDMREEVGGPHRRVGIMWSDGDGIDYEPLDWMEVISEGR